MNIIKKPSQPLEFHANIICNIGMNITNGRVGGTEIYMANVNAVEKISAVLSLYSAVVKYAEYGGITNI